MIEPKNETFPMISDSQWWALRRRFKQSMPSGTVDANALSIILGIDEKTVRLSPFKRIGLFDNEGKVSERARRWRDDEQYATVCAEILAEVYPESLRAAVPDPASDFDRAMRWFANRTGGGDSAARKMALTYKLVAKADLSRTTEITKSGKGTMTASKKVTPKGNAAQTERAATLPEAETAAPVTTTTGPMSLPTVERPVTPFTIMPKVSAPTFSIHFHLPSDATPEYVEQFFQIATRYASSWEETKEATTTAA